MNSGKHWQRYGYGYVYFAATQEEHRLVKVGYSYDPENRCRDIQSTYRTARLSILDQIEVKERRLGGVGSGSLERRVHDRLEPYRVSEITRRYKKASEFYDVSDIVLRETIEWARSLVLGVGPGWFLAYSGDHPQCEAAR
jgi:hypothetical protein